MTPLEKIHKYYLEKKSSWEQLAQEVIFTIHNELQNRYIYIELSYRIKEIQSVVNKAEIKKITDPEKIKDYCGIRCVCIFSEDTDMIEKILYSKFHVIDLKALLDFYEVERMGYKSRHYFAKLSNQFSGPRYDSLKDLLFEFQLRTVTQHAWAIASHKLVYKKEDEQSIPHIVRRINNVSSSLELIQHEMDNIQRELKRINNERLATRQNSLFNIEDEISLSSLTAYCNAKFLVNEVSSTWLEQIYKNLIQLNYTKLREVDEAVNSTYKDVFIYSKEHPRFFRYSSDYLSKCLTFFDSRFLSIHPMSEVTRKRAEEYQINKQNINKT